MPKYLRKPVVVDAEQFWPADWPPHEPQRYPCGVYKERYKYYIDTPGGRQEVKPGDYIVTEAKGEKYSCKSDVFAATHELVEGDETPALHLGENSP